MCYILSYCVCLQYNSCSCRRWLCSGCVWHSTEWRIYDSFPRCSEDLQAVSDYTQMSSWPMLCVIYWLPIYTAVSCGFYKVSCYLISMGGNGIAFICLFVFALSFEPTDLWPWPFAWPCLAGDWRSRSEIRRRIMVSVLNAVSWTSVHHRGQFTSIDHTCTVVQGCISHWPK